MDSSRSAASSRKRKHAVAETQPADGEAGPSAIKVNVNGDASEPGPAFVSFPAVRPSKTTPFTLYHRQGASTSAHPFAHQQTLIAGETADVEFFSVNKDLAPESGASDEYYQCQYLPALYDPSSGSVVFHPSTPTYVLAQRVKRLKSTATGTLNPSIPYEQRLLMRNQLGEAFGTRKAKSRIKAEERNKVDARALEGVQVHLMSGIEEAAKVMPKIESESEVAIPRFIPTPNLETTDPNSVYPIMGVLIPKEEFDAIPVDQFNKNQTDSERMELLPFKHSRWIEQKLRTVLHGGSAGERRKLTKCLYYIACIRRFARMARSLDKPENLLEKMNGIPKIIIDGLISRFTETSKGSSKPVVTPGMMQKLLAYDFALRLHCENQACEVEPIAKDLQVATEKIREVFKSLGCTLEMVDSKTRERMGISMEDAKAKRRAVLQAPPEFPKARRGAPARR